MQNHTAEAMTAERLAAIEAAINAGNTTPEDLRELLTEVKRARTYGDDQYTEADYWRESYRLTKGLTMDEISAMTAVRDAFQVHPRPCWFPHKGCVCDHNQDLF